jgi:pimeloyl-ACP methyl ester carboxylesterase
MIFNNKPEEVDFDFLKKEITNAAEPLVENVRNQKPNKKNLKYDSLLAENSGIFFRAAADKIDDFAKNQNTVDKSQKSDETNWSSTLSTKGAEMTAKAAQLVGGSAQGLKGTVLDNASNLGDNAAQLMKDAKLDKKAAGLAESTGAIFGTATDRAAKTLKDAKLDKKLEKANRQARQALKQARLDEKLGGASDWTVKTLKDAKLDEKLSDVTGRTVKVLKDAKLDEKLTDVTDRTVKVLKDAKLDERFSDVTDRTAKVLKDAKLDEKLSDASDWAAKTLKDAKLDEKLSDASALAAKALKDAKLDEKLSEASTRVSKALGEAQLPEKVFEAASLLPGVTIKNPKKAAKQFRKRRDMALKKANQYQRELSKKLPFVEQKKKSFPWVRTGLGVVGGTGLVAGGLAANNARIWGQVRPLVNRLPGEPKQFYSNFGTSMTYYKMAGQDRDATPVVFVHGIGAGGSSYEWLENFGVFAERHPVYAYDLLGFGNSHRPNIRYTAEVYIQQLTEFLQKVVEKPAVIVASSLSASYAVQVAYRQPDLVEKLVLLEPTGINPRAAQKKVQILPEFFYGLLRAPILGKSLYSFVAARSSIRSFLESQLFYDKSLVNNEMVEQYYTSAHQPGAEFAPPSFFTGLLNAEIGETIGKLKQPILAVFGKESRITTVDEANALKSQNPRIQLEILPGARMLVHWEKADYFNQRALDFLASSEDKTPHREEVKKPRQSENELAGASHYTRQNGTGSANEAAQPAGENSTDIDLQQELKEHREAFLGDAQIGGALIDPEQQQA